MIRLHRLLDHDTDRPYHWDIPLRGSKTENRSELCKSGLGIELSANRLQGQ